MHLQSAEVVADCSTAAAAAVDGNVAMKEVPRQVAAASRAVAEVVAGGTVPGWRAEGYPLERGCCRS